jgi:hypothetical protein
MLGCTTHPGASSYVNTKFLRSSPIRPRISAALRSRLVMFRC